MVEPVLMCRAHLLGEHRELHALCGILRKGISIQGYLDNKLLELGLLNIRHDQLVAEMIVRGYDHHTPMDFNARVYYDGPLGRVDRALSFADLIDRCPNCAIRAESHSK